MNLRRYAASLAFAVTVLVPTASTAVDRDASVDAAGHSDVALRDHFLVVEDHWIELDGTATIETPCGERVLQFHLSVRGRENFYADTYEYSVDFPAGELELRDGSDVVLEATTTLARLRLRYPRPSGPPGWNLLGDWLAVGHRILLPDCSWSDPLADDFAGSFSLRPEEQGMDAEGMQLGATGVITEAVSTPVGSGTASLGSIKVRFR